MTSLTDESLRKRRRKAFDVDGQRFHMLLVTGRAGKAADGKTLWGCLCDCGNTVLATTGELRRVKGKKHCGCGRPQRDTLPTEHRFWLHVDKRGKNECWPWTGGTAGFGYGRFRLGRKSDGMISAHRFSYEMHHGPVPEGLFVMHRCDNPPCVNPKHLTVGTPQDNTLDCHRKGRAGYQRARENRNAGP